MFSSTARALTPRRALAASIALLCVAMQGASSTHLVLTRHAVCPAHGELVHAHADAPPAGSRPRAEALAVVAAFRAAPGVGTGEHADEHCAALATRREYALLAAAVERPISPLATPIADAPPHDVRLPDGRVRYDVAPKQSPPA